jgi:hypothetical protein
MIELDLHGVTHDNAVRTLEGILVGESTKGSFQLRVITGNSTRMQKRLIDEVLDTMGFQYNIPASNLGEIIVTYTKL